MAKPGDIVRVEVMEVDAARKRISLTMRLDDQPGVDGKQQAGAPKGQAPQKNMSAAPKGNRPEASGGAFADAFRRAGLNGKV